MGGIEHAKLPAWGKQRMVEAIVIAGVSAGGTYGVIDYRVGHLEASAARVAAALQTQTIALVKLELLAANFESHRGRPYHEGAAVEMSATKLRLETAEDRVKNIAARMRDVEDAIPRRMEDGATRTVTAPPP